MLVEKHPETPALRRIVVDKEDLKLLKLSLENTKALSIGRLSSIQKLMLTTYIAHFHIVIEEMI